MYSTHNFSPSWLPRHRKAPPFLLDRKQKEGKLALSELTSFLSFISSESKRCFYPHFGVGTFPMEPHHKQQGICQY